MMTKIPTRTLKITSLDGTLKALRISWRLAINDEFYTEGGKDKVDLSASRVVEGGEVEVSTSSPTFMVSNKISHKHT